MAIMMGVTSALSAFMNDGLNIHDPLQREIACIKLIAKLPTFAAMAYRISHGLPIVQPIGGKSLAWNFLNMVFNDPMKPNDTNIPPLFVKAFDTILILMADHEQNASTCTVRIAGSSFANPYACIAGGMASLWGPAHGGANEAALAMLEEIDNEENIPKFIKRAKDKSDPYRLMGFGHRVYKNYDPRAKVMKELFHSILK